MHLLYRRCQRRRLFGWFELSQTAACAVEAMFEQERKWMKTFPVAFHPERSCWFLEGVYPCSPPILTDKPPTAAGNILILKQHIRTPLPRYVANTSNKHRAAPVRTQKQPWRWIIKGKYTFPQRRRITTGFYFLIAVILLSCMGVVIIELNF